jgi:hypothetical protein
MNQDPQMFVELTTARSPLEVEALVAALRDHGIEAIGFNHAASVMQSTAVPLTISVHREDFERAKATLAEIRSDASEMDWDQLDVGEVPEEVQRELSRTVVKFPRRIARVVLFTILAVIAIGFLLRVVGILGMLFAGWR